MDSRRWQRVKRILDKATEVEGPALTKFLEKSCGGDSELIATLRSLLAFDQQGEATLDRPLFDVHTKDPRLGRRIGPYRIVALLGRGGMGTVYLARREDDFTKEVAIKLIQRGMDTDERIARFHEERQILANLEHPLIARLLDGGTTEEGLPYLVMERIEGEPLDRFCDSHAWNLDQRLGLFCQVLEAVDFLHRHLVVHRDLKPENILVTADGSPRLIDFGISKLLRPSKDGTPGAIQPRHRRASPLYASPEQIRGEALTPASDVFALGIALHELLCGSHPFGRPQSQEELERLLLESRPAAPSTTLGSDGAGSESAAAAARKISPAKLRRRLSGDLDAIVLMALNRRPEDRYPSAGLLREDLEAHLAHRPIRARRGHLLSRLRKLLRRERLAFAALVLAVAALSSLLVALAYRARAEQQRSQAAAVESFVGELFRAAGPDRADGEDLTVRELLDHGFENLTHGPESEPLVHSALLAVVGRVYHDLGELSRARTLHQEALDLQRRHDPGDDLTLARRANDLAVVLREQGDLEAAESLYRESLRGFGGCRSPQADAIWVAGNLAWLRTENGDWTEAEALLECSLERCEDPSIAVDVPACSAILAKLGALYYRQSRFEEAENVFQRVVAMREGYFGLDHTDTATAFHNLGQAQARSGKVGEAARHLGRALAIRSELLGEEHYKTASTARALAQIDQEEAQGHEK